MNITVVGLGYVGSSLAALLAQENEVIGLDIDPIKIDFINSNSSPIYDVELNEFYNNNKLRIEGTTDPKIAYKKSDFVIICTQTNYDPETNEFDVDSILHVINDVFKINHKSTIIIKSTIPIGFTDRIQREFPTLKIIFSPEFLREGKSIHDNIYPSRIIIGDNSKEAKKFSKLLINISKNEEKNLQVLFMKPTEAEAVKLFANTYLAMRISFFNELDSFSQIHNLSSHDIINGIGSDVRIGNHYNNPSFGYGGYCLPKDTKQLLSNFKDTPNNIIKAVIDSNLTRKKFIAESIINKKPESVGVYRLIMKADSNNFRESSVFDVIKILKKKNIKIYVFEPNLKETTDEFIHITDFKEFVERSDLIIANRMTEELEKFKKKLFTRDIFRKN